MFVESSKKRSGLLARVKRLRAKVAKKERIARLKEEEEKLKAKLRKL